jgi:hypothetical protein
MASAAQLKAKAKFKEAIAYRAKHGCSLKDAFRHAYGKNVSVRAPKPAPKKKVGAVKKKTIPKKGAMAVKTHKDTKSHNVNIRVISGVKKKSAPKTNKIGNWYEHKPFTLTELKKIHKEFFRNGYDAYFFVKGKKLIVSKKLDCQVYIEKQNVPYLGVQYTARKVAANGAFGETKRFSNISELENYVDKHIKF